MEEKYNFGHMMERDIDLFLLYSFVLDKSFLKLFTGQIEKKLAFPEVVGVEISREEHLLGESDVTVHLKDGKYRHAIIIEDKIGAVAQPDQCARYYKRGNVAIENGEYEGFDVFICAPQNYINFNPEAAKYEHSVSFEDIEDYLSGRDDPFSKLRLAEIRYVLYSPDSKYTSIPDDNATELWMKYQGFVRENYPELKLCNTVGYKPKGGSWIEYKTPHKHSVVQLMHKVDKGHVELQFSKFGANPDLLAGALRDQIGNYEENGFEVIKASGSASLAKDFGEKASLDFDQSFESQRAIIEEQVYWINELNSIAKQLDMSKIVALRSEL